VFLVLPRFAADGIECRGRDTSTGTPQQTEGESNTAMRITCPHCGERSLEEFTYLGDASERRPEAGLPAATERPSGGERSAQVSSSDVAAFARYVYARENPAFAHEGLWYHGLGCRLMLVVARNPTTHEIHSVALARDVARARDAAAATARGPGEGA